MSVMANRIRNLVLDKYVDIMLIGDYTPLLLTLWGSPTDLYNVYQRRFMCGDTKVVCNVWDLSLGTDTTRRMYHLDGTENSGFDYCIIVYNAIRRRDTTTNINKYLAIKDNIQEQQHINKPCAVVVLIIKTLNTSEEVYEHITSYCKEKNIHYLLVNNLKEDLHGLRDLPEKLSNIVLEQRKAQLARSRAAILHTVNNGNT